MASKYVIKLVLPTLGGENKEFLSKPTTREAANRAAIEYINLGYTATVHPLEPEKVNTRGKRKPSGAKVIGGGSLHPGDE